MKNSVVKATVIYLPDQENPQYIAMKDGIGSKKLDLKLADGSVNTFSMDTDPKIDEFVAAVTSLVSKTAPAITDLSTPKGVLGMDSPASITEVYDIMITNNITTVRKIEIK